MRMGLWGSSLKKLFSHTLWLRVDSAFRDLIGRGEIRPRPFFYGIHENFREFMRS